ncbi:MAG: substrate-binding domain-containing protein [Hespellia sp.]|nr:substrate-binding domain-containing protein [Hespellia sp.]
MKKWKAIGLAAGVIICICGTILFIREDHMVYASEVEKIIPITREAGSGTRAAFANLVGLEGTNFLGMAENEIGKDVAVVGSSEEMVHQVELTPDGIGYVSMGALDLEEADVKTLKVDGTAAKKDTILNGCYKLTRPLELIYNADLSDLENDFLSYLKSAGQGVVASTQYVPVRNEGIHLKKEVTGEITVSGSTSMAPLMQKLAQAYMQENPKVTVTVTSSDSEKGMLDVTQGISNFGMVSREIYGYEKELFESETIAKDAIAIIVNNKNSIEDISLKQLQDIYEEKTESWGFLGILD